MRAHLVDGTYELFRAFYGAPAREGKGGLDIGATRALALSLLALVTKEGATHVAVAFDHVIESFRNDLFPGYKTGEGIDPRLRAQFEPAEAVARALGMVVWPMIELEADDALATAAHRLAEIEDIEQVVVCSPDKDLMQCVQGDRVVVRDRRRRTTYDAAAVQQKMGVAPASIPDYLALVGDSADGIPGVPRWGAKSAAGVLSVYEHLEAVPEDPALWAVPVRGASALAASLAEHRDEALLYRTLATLRRDVPLDLDLPSLAWRGADRQLLAALEDEVGGLGLTERMPKWR